MSKQHYLPGGEGMSMDNVGANIRRLRSIHDMKQDDLADRLNVSRQMLHHYENGGHKIPEAIVEKIETIFNIDVSILCLPSIALLLKTNTRKES